MPNYAPKPIYADKREERMKKGIDPTALWTAAKEHGLRYFAAIVTGALTGYAGYSFTTNYWYALTLVVLAEGASLYWPSRLETVRAVKTGKHWHLDGIGQWLCALLGIALSWISIVATDISSAAVIATSNDNAMAEIFSVFAKVPDWSQQVIVYVLPVLAFSHGALLTLFYILSEDAEIARSIRGIERSATLSIRRSNADAEMARAQAYVNKHRAIATKAATAKGEQEAVESVDSTYAVNPTKRQQPS